jgi:hypothetical protein
MLRTMAWPLGLYISPKATTMKGLHMLQGKWCHYGEINSVWKLYDHTLHILINFCAQCCNVNDILMLLWAVTMTPHRSYIFQKTAAPYKIMCHGFLDITRMYSVFTKWKLSHHWWVNWAHGSVVGWGTMLQAGRSQAQIPMRCIFSIYLILPATLWSWCQLSL